ncbi:bifunctional methylenetetrahydrofolate dehydrogenase/methenyltetrahydrofolate cyclohydrolase FolD [Bacillus sp. RG28]|uniref:Bifunctional protein FolD n=1 Tax=Gottfriedia endophytica TaxID=2820819 RepID=A0A940NLJ8_9BACI|nr:bifunctional methylenetetrahydrofolate dehydrogenase/methenyltetrahydrofolate cyclohydrolase FolD [Gottfriedia endophytica]MBP0724409.1 bifunctional methylenetetrahydrofolate dehydrogenase/methenyltetrahydrofolate cyclohydrolase FolD [Gottfriedia endophytica]
MVANLINGKEISSQMKETLKGNVAELIQQGVTPGLAVVLVGDNSASRTYVNSKHKACNEIGVYSEVIELPESVTEEKLLEIVNQLNHDDKIHGILVQLPLPKHISEKKVIETISPLKDVDGFHPINIGRMMTGQDALLPCTPFGILKMIQTTGISISGKHVVVIGRSNIVGKPVGQLFLNENATVTYTHSRSKNITELTKQADILIVAIGVAKFVTAEYVKDGAIVIDVGMNRDENGKLCGDVNFDEVKEVAGYITPVPGGVGPMTITMLLHNTVKAAKVIENISSTM